MNISLFGIFVLFPLFRTQGIAQRTNAKKRQLTFVILLPPRHLGFLILNLVNCIEISRNHSLEKYTCARMKVEEIQNVATGGIYLKLKSDICGNSKSFRTQNRILQLQYTYDAAEN